MNVEAKVKIAAGVEKQNELTAEQNKLSAEKNKHDIAKTLLESGHATDEQKTRACKTLDGLL